MRMALWKMNDDYFGFRDGDGLWHRTGNYVSKFHGDEVFDLDGRHPRRRPAYSQAVEVGESEGRTRRPRQPRGTTSRRSRDGRSLRL